MQRESSTRRPGLPLAAIALTATLFASCTDASPPPQKPTREGIVSLIAGASSLRAGNYIDLTLRNGTRERVGYNLCSVFLQLEERKGQTWGRVDRRLSEKPGGCTLPLYSLEPSAEAQGRAFILEKDGGRTYRISTEVEVGTTRTRVATEPFEVIRRKAPTP
jgi:hypothetical protein